MNTNKQPIKTIPRCANCRAVKIDDGRWILPPSCFNPRHVMFADALCPACGERAGAEVIHVTFIELSGVSRRETRPTRYILRSGKMTKWPATQYPEIAVDDGTGEYFVVPESPKFRWYNALNPLTLVK